MNYIQLEGRNLESFNFSLKLSFNNKETVRFLKPLINI